MAKKKSVPAKNVLMPAEYRNKAGFVICTYTVCQGLVILDFEESEGKRHPTVYTTERDAQIAALDWFEMMTSAFKSGNDVNFDDLQFPGNEHVLKCNVDFKGNIHVAGTHVWTGDVDGGMIRADPTTAVCDG